MPRPAFHLSVCASFLLLSLPLLHASPRVLSVDLASPGKAISPQLLGVFFEDLNYAADGGLYAELVQNRSFAYQATEQPSWNNLSFWELVNQGGKGSLKVESAFPLHPNNPHYAVLSVETVGEGVGLSNGGFDGIPLKAGDSYELSFFAREQHFGHRWNDVGKSGPLPLLARLVARDGTVIAESSFEIREREWRRFSATLTPARSEQGARLVLLGKARGGIGLDEISLFPKNTFRGRPNGLRADLAQAIADLKPRFMRFPGGCLVHGNGLGNMYRWKDTLGPIEQRRQQSNLWGYHQSMGLGYYEYFQFCEDIGAAPLPVVAAGVCCQNSGTGLGQAGLPLAEMPAYIQEVLDLIEWANGPVDSPWGAKRAAAGHPAPFGLKYVGLGNEDQITPVFRERFKLLHDAVRAKHPEITFIGTSGPFPDGEDFDKGWAIAREERVAMVDEHYYKSPQWFWDNLGRYDSYDRSQSKVYVGEYAAHDDKRRSTLRSALAEAAFLTSLERNGDVVHMASYAPLLARRGHTQWTPDLIYFNATEVYPTLNYTVQRLFGENRGDHQLHTRLEPTPAGALDGQPAPAASSPAGQSLPPAAAAAPKLAFSTVREALTVDIILKVVNGENAPQSLLLRLENAKALPGSATLTLLAGDPDLANEDGKSPVVEPRVSTLKLAPELPYEAPAHSLTILRFKGR